MTKTLAFKAIKKLPDIESLRSTIPTLQMALAICATNSKDAATMINNLLASDKPDVITNFIASLEAASAELEAFKVASDAARIRILAAMQILHDDLKARAA